MNPVAAGTLLVLTILLAACSGETDPERRFEARSSAAIRDVALAECDDMVDTRMQLHGFPRRPSQETPQYRYRQVYFEKCMRDKGFEPD